MAERRMFSCKITSSDAFKMMSLAAQALYFQLGMEADDDGFVNNAVSIARSIGASAEHIEEIVRNRFAIRMNSSLLVIKHWRINNWIRSDRKQDTAYKQYMALLTVKDNGAYTEKQKAVVGCQSSDRHVTDTCQTNATILDTEDSIGKDSIDYRVSVVPTKKNPSINKKSLSNETDTLFAPSDSDESSKPQEKAEIFITFTLNDKTEYEVTKDMIDEWKTLYPAVDVEQELRNIRGWCNSNPTQRKTRKGALRFVNGWLSKEQNRAGGKGNGTDRNDFYGGKYIKGTNIRMDITASGDRSQYNPNDRLEDIL